MRTRKNWGGVIAALLLITGCNRYNNVELEHSLEKKPTPAIAGLDQAEAHLRATLHDCYNQYSCDRNHQVEAKLADCLLLITQARVAAATHGSPREEREREVAAHVDRYLANGTGVVSPRRWRISLEIGESQ